MLFEAMALMFAQQMSFAAVARTVGESWPQTRQTNGFLETINGLFQAVKRKARGYTNLATMRTVLFLIAGKLNFSKIHPHAS